jgi:mono/diheme cytochrome c family protein
VKRALFLTGLSARTRAGGWDKRILHDMAKAIWCGGILLALGVVAVLVLAPVRAQNLDEGKSGARLFADSCVTCHHRARGLTKGRFRLSLYLFLQQHYASNSSAAWELASYLESVDETPRGRSPRAAAKKPPHGAGLAGGSLRPPAPIPQR